MCTLILCECGGEIHPKRYELGYKTCLSCGSPPPKRTIVPMHKGHYMPVTTRRDVSMCAGKTAGWHERSDQ